MASRTLTEEADRLIAAGAPAQAVALVDRYAAQDDPDALMRLATWRLIGAPLPRDLPAARALLRRAVTAGHADAALMEVALTANGSGGPADWRAARRLLEVTARGDPVAADQLALLNAMDLTADGAPASTPEGERLSTRPDVRRFPRFFSEAECRHVAMAAREMLAPAQVIDPVTGAAHLHPIRTAHDAVFGPAREDLVIRALNRRIAAASGTAVEQGEPLTVLHYGVGQEYRLHHDALAETANQRGWTMLVYLNDAYTGGETTFPAANLSIKGRAGDGLLFGNLAGGRADPAARHQGRPVTGGAKWLCTRWIRVAPYDPWGPRTE